MKVEQSARQPLPGTIDVSRCTRLTADIGKCSICGLEKAVWADPSDMGVHLCEHCYGREVGGRMGTGIQDFYDEPRIIKKEGRKS